MGKGILNASHEVIAKTMLKLPDGYEVVDVYLDRQNGISIIKFIIEHESIPDLNVGQEYPEIRPTYRSVHAYELNEIKIVKEGDT